jgi:hypothetical protein
MQHGLHSKFAAALKLASESGRALRKHLAEDRRRAMGMTRFLRIEKAEAWLDAAHSRGAGSTPALCMTHGRILGPVERARPEEKGGIVIREALQVARNRG